MQGGNAVDAAVAIAAALNVVEPYMSGAGGVGYMFIYDAKSKKRIVLDYNGPSAYAAELSKYKHEDDKQKGILSPLIPGSLGGWLTALEKYGTMDRATVFQPAIEYAEGGFPLSINNERHFKVSEEYLLKWKTSREQYAPEGHTPTAGAILKLPNLARTFRTIVEGGMEAFYKGDIGKEIVRFSEENGGLITQKDLDDFTPEWVEPITVNYRGYDDHFDRLVDFDDFLNAVERLAGQFIEADDAFALGADIHQNAVFVNMDDGSGDDVAFGEFFEHTFKVGLAHAVAGVGRRGAGVTVGAGAGGGGGRLARGAGRGDGGAVPLASGAGDVASAGVSGVAFSGGPEGPRASQHLQVRPT